MRTIMFAVKDKAVEEAIYSLLDMNQYAICYSALYKDAVLEQLDNFEPDILVLREGLDGKISISDLIKEIRVKHQKTRIIFMASAARERTDMFIQNLVSLGIYDILTGKSINLREVASCIKVGRTLADVYDIISERVNSVNVEEQSVVRIIDNENDVNSTNQPINNNISKNQGKSLSTVFNESTAESKKDIKDVPDAKEELKKDSTEEELENISSAPESLNTSSENKNERLSEDEQKELDKALEEIKSSEKNESGGTYTETVPKKEPIRLDSTPMKSEKKKRFSFFSSKKNEQRQSFSQKIILVQGSAPGIGASIVATNLAVCLSQNAQTILIDGSEEQRIISKLLLPAQDFININSLRLSIKGPDLSRIAKLPQNLNFASVNSESLSSLLEKVVSNHIYIVIYGVGYKSVMNYVNTIMYVTNQESYFIGKTINQINENRVTAQSSIDEIAVLNRYSRSSKSRKDFAIQERLGTSLLYTVADDFPTIVTADELQLPETVVAIKSPLSNSIYAMSQGILQNY